MLKFKVIVKFFLIFLVFMIFPSCNGQNYFSCVERENECVLSDISSSNQLENYLTNNNGITYTYYHSYNRRNQQGSREFREITEISCNNTKMEKLPPVFFEKFSRLLTFKASKTEITEVNRDDFKFANFLLNLDLSNNKISRLDNMVFMYLKQLNVLDLSSNEISSIHDGAFEDISKRLTKINLSFNKILTFNENHFVNLGKSLNFSIFINLENNKIAEILQQNSSEIAKIKFLDLQNNEIASFVSSRLEIAELLINNNKLITLNIHGVEVLQANNNKLDKLFISKVMREVSVINNEIRELNCDKNLTIESLLLSGNEITKKEFQEIKNATMMKILDLSDTLLGPMPVDSFAEMTELEELNLSHSNVSKISFGLFAHQKSLKVLRIADNHLGFIDYHMFSNLESLTFLDISGNNLTKLNDYENFYEIFRNLTRIGLENNSWNCEYLSKLRMSLEGQGIKVEEPKNPVKTESSIKGIGCSTSKQLPIPPVSSDQDSSKLLEKLNEVIETTNNLTAEVNAMKSSEISLKQLILNLQNEMLTLKSENVKNQIYGANVTNLNNIRNLVEQMNNLTLQRQQLGFDQLNQKISEQNLEIRKQKLDMTFKINDRKEQQPMVQEKPASFSTVEVLLILVVSIGLIASIIFTINYFKNYLKSKIDRPSRPSRTNSTNTITTLNDSTL